MRFLKDILILTGVLALAFPALLRAEPDALLHKIEGKVLVNAAGQDKFEPAAAGSPLLFGDRVKTPKDSSAQVVFLGGDEMLVRGESAFELSGSAKNTSVSFSSGEFLVKIKRSQAPGESFEVKTPGGSASMRGGALWGRHDALNGSTFQTFAADASITAQGKTVVLAPGMTLNVPPGGPPGEPASATPAVLEAFGPEGSLAGLAVLEPAPAAEPSPALPPPPEPRSFRAPRIRIELHPFFRFTETYDDNIYLVAPDKPGPQTVGGGVVGSWISAGNLGLNFAVPLSPKHKFVGGSDLNAIIYSKQPRANNAYNTSADLAYVYAGKASSAKLSNVFQNTELPAFSELVARQRHWQDTTKLTLELAKNRTFVYDLDAAHMIVKYIDPSLSALLNHYEQLFGGRLGVKLAPKTKAFLAYHRGIAHYSAGRNANSKSHLVDVGVEGELAERLKGLIQTGYQYRRYDFNTKLPGVARLWQASVELKFQATRALLLNLRGSRDFSESTFGANRYYTASGASLTAVYVLRKLTLGLNGSVEYDRYPQNAAASGVNALRKDDLYGAGVNADYEFRKWLKAGVAFKRLDRFSNFSRQFNYRDDRTSLSFGIAF